MKKDVLSLCGILSITIVCIQCNWTSEPIAYGDYYITNNSLSKLIVAASEVELLAAVINPGEKTHIFTFTEGSGGHVMPSNAWSEFYIYSEYMSDNTIIYSGIENSDWKFEGGSSENHEIYNLTIE